MPTSLCYLKRGKMKGFVVFILLLSSFAGVLGEEAEALTDSALPPHPPVGVPTHAEPPTHHHHHHHNQPSHPPLHPPTPPPVHPPAHPPTHLPPPTHPPVHPPAQYPPPSHPPVHPPSHPPVHPPSHPPVHPPSHPPVLPPIYPPSHPPSRPPHRKLVAVQGVVFCKSCEYKGIDTLSGASALLGATVKLQCNNTKYPLVVLGKADKNGYFFIQVPKKVTTYGAHKCKVSLVSSPLQTCNIPTDLHGGLNGATLRAEKPAKPAVGKPPPPFALFSVGPFAFEPAKDVKCHP